MTNNSYNIVVTDLFPPTRAPALCLPRRWRASRSSCPCRCGQPWTGKRSSSLLAMCAAAITCCRLNSPVHHKDRGTAAFLCNYGDSAASGAVEVAVVMPPHHPLWRLRRGERGAGQVDVAPLLHEHVPVPVDLRLQPYGKGKRAFAIVPGTQD